MIKPSTFLNFFLILFMFSSSNIAQVSQIWTRLYDGSGHSEDVSDAIAIDGNGNIYISGYIGINATNRRLCTIKYLPNGDTAWVRIYNGYNYVNGGAPLRARSMVIDSSANVYVTGPVQGPSGIDYVTIKYNSAGVQQWVTFYGSTNNSNDWPHAIAVDNSGNVYVTGANGNLDIATVKYNSSGVQQWVSIFNSVTNGNDDGRCIGLDGSGNVYVSGNRVYGGSYMVVIKYNSGTGDSIWVRQSGLFTTSGDGVRNMKVDAAGNTYITGQFNNDMTTVKFNTSGTLQWTSSFVNPNGSWSDDSRSIAVDTTGNVYVTGWTENNSFNLDYTTIKYNSSGVQQWLNKFNGTSNTNDISNAICLDTYGDPIVTGKSNGSDITTIKYYNNGTNAWNITYTGTGLYGAEGRAIASDNNGNVYVTGYSYTNTDFDMILIKYQDNTFNIKKISENIPKEFALLQNYPNPFNPTTKIKFDLPNPSKGGAIYVTLKIYDILGREVATLIPPLRGGQEGLQPGTYEVEWDGSYYPSGVYFYKLSATGGAGSFIDTKKMILLK